MAATLIHGTVDGYCNKRCRCRPCKDAWASYYWSAMRQKDATTQCSINGCDGGIYARELCKAHYMRERNGLPMDVPIERRPVAQGVQPGKQR